jgi:hypothetical protein
MEQSSRVSCPLCGQVWNTLAEYYSHALAVHPTARGDALCPKCPNPGTQEKRYRRAALYDHDKKHHRPCGQNATIECKDCRILITTNQLNAHIRLHAGQSSKFTCPYSDCDVVLQSSSKHFTERCTTFLTKHRRSCHGGEEKFDVVNVNTNRLEEFNDEEPALEADFDGDEEMTPNDDMSANEDRKAYERKFWAAWLDVEFCQIMPETLVTNLIKKLAKLADRSSKHLRQKLFNLLPGNEVPIEAAFETDDWMTLCFLDPALSSSKRRKTEANTLANILETQQNDSMRVLKSANNAAIQNVSIENTILNALESSNWNPDRNAGFPEEMDNVKYMRRRGFPLIAGYRDSVRYKEVEASVLPEERPAIHLLLYSDEFDRDMMGSSSQRHKMHVSYIRVLNLVDGLCRTPEDYHLVQVLPSQILKDVGYQKVMLPLIADLKKVVEDGITYKGRKFAVRLATLQGDGLERAAMFGMAGNFSTLSHCDPLSYLTTKTRLECKSVEEIMSEAKNRRNRDTYADDLSQLHERERKERALRASRNVVAGRKSLKAKYEYTRGLKYDSPFHSVPHFHVTDKGALVYCIAHDLYSGAFRSDMARVLIALSNGNHFTWSDLQAQFRMYRASLIGEEKYAWYDVISIKNTFKQLPGNHASNHLVIRFLSTFWISRSPDDAMFKTTAWELYLAMKKVSEAVSRKVVNGWNRANLKDLVRNYLEVRLLHCCILEMSFPISCLFNAVWK